MIWLLLACSGGDAKDDTGPVDTADADTDTDSDTDTDTDTLELDGVCSDAEHWGAFQVDSNEDYSYVTGTVANGVVPAAVLTNALSSGDCTIWRRENPFCDPSCEPGYTCDFDGTCVPYPENQDVGTVSVTGLLQPVSMTPVTPGYTYFDTSLPNPPWEPGSVITVTTGGGAYEAAAVYGIAPLSLDPPSMAWEVVAGEALPITWDTPTEAVRTEVVLTLSIDQHGITPSRVECVFEDDGSAEVPADVLASLMEFGVSGFPEGHLARRTADSAPIGGGCVDLEVTSSRLASVSIAGYTPCRSDAECPEGQECNEAMERCE
jgi:hypothetical protein